MKPKFSLLELGIILFCFSPLPSLFLRQIKKTWYQPRLNCGLTLCGVCVSNNQNSINNSWFWFLKNFSQAGQHLKPTPWCVLTLPKQGVWTWWCFRSLPTLPDGGKMPGLTCKVHFSVSQEYKQGEKTDHVMPVFISAHEFAVYGWDWGRGKLLGLILTPGKPSRALGLPGFPCEAASRENPEQLPLGPLRNVFFKENLYENGGHTLPCRGFYSVGDKGNFIPLWFEIALFGKNTMMGIPPKPSLWF